MKTLKAGGKLDVEEPGGAEMPSTEYGTKERKKDVAKKVKAVQEQVIIK